VVPVLVVVVVMVVAVVWVVVTSMVVMTVVGGRGDDVNVCATLSKRAAHIRGRHCGVVATTTTSTTTITHSPPAPPLANTYLTVFLRMRYVQSSCIHNNNNNISLS